MRDADYKENWERMRLLATITIQPHIKQKLTAQKLLPFAWDKKNTSSAPKAKKITAEQRRKRMDDIVRKLGETT